jgi:predicted DNA-binding transcriptional regulator YafY
MDKVRVVSQSVPLLPPEIRKGVLDSVSTALYYDHWLDIDYINVQGERKIKRVMPLGLAQQGARMILVVRFEGHDNERSLALNRIQSAHDTGLRFKPFGFDLAKYDDDGRFGFGEGKEIELKFRIEKLSGIFLTESKLSKDQQVKDLGDWLEISATVMESEQLIWWLRGFGERVELIAPKQLATRIKYA